MIVARLMQPGERDSVAALAQSYSRIKEFTYLWKLWGNWEPWPPVVVVDGGRLIGFHAYTFTLRQPRYLNSYYIGVDKDSQGKGIAGATVAFLLQRSAAEGVQRIKTKHQPDSPGRVFWEGFGLRHFGVDPKGHLMVDSDLGGCDTVERWIEWNGRKEEHQPIPPKALDRYVKAGVKLL